MTETSARLKPLKGEASRIFKLCLDKDINTALQGLELASVLGEPLEGLLSDVMVDTEGKLIRGKRFTAKDKTQAFLDALLLIQLALAPKGSPEAKVRNSITTLDCRLPVVIDLSNFSGLKTLQITLNGSFKGEDLTGLGKLPKLKSLILSRALVMYGEKSASLASLNGLDAPMLEVFEGAYLDIIDIEGLSGCSKLKRVDIHGNSRLTSIDSLQSSDSSLEDLVIRSCSSISSLKCLSKAFNLRYLDMRSLKQIKDVLDLKNLTKLESIGLSGCEKLNSFKGLSLKYISDFYRPPESEIDSLILNDMKSLTSFEHIPPLDPEVIELRINRAPSLKDLANFANSGEVVSKLQMNQVGISDLGVLASMVNLETIEISECADLVDATALANLTKLSSVRITKCRKLLRLPDVWKSSVKNLVLTGCDALQPLKALPPGIDAKTIEIDNRRLLPRAKPTKALKSDVGAVWKLLSSREIPNIFMGLELSAALDPKDLSSLVAEVDAKDGKLVRGKRFTGTGPAQPYLDMALIGLLARTPTSDKLTKIRSQLTVLDLTLLSQAFPLDGFINLKHLNLFIGDEETADLSSFGVMPKLNYLKIMGKRWGSNGALKSLNGLNAPNLTEADLSYCKLEDISALIHSPKIKKLTLSNNPSLSHLKGLEACTPNLIELDLQDCEKISTVDILKAAKKLRSLNLFACSRLTSVLPLAACNSLETLNLEHCSQLNSLEGLAKLPLKPEKLYGGDTQFSLDGCSALKSLAHLPEMEGKLNTLSIEHTSSLKNLEGLIQLTSVRKLNANHSGITDLKHLSSLPALTHISLRNCMQLIDARPVGLLKKLKDVNLSNSAVAHLPTAWLGPVDHLVLNECHNITSLGSLPAGLINLICDESSGIVRIDGMDACQKLEHLSVKSCPALIELGSPPSSVREIVAQGCTKLTSLKGLENCTQLANLALPTTIVDVSSIKHRNVIQIYLDLFELGNPKVKGQLASLPSALIEAINTLPSVSLKIKGPTGSWHSARSIDLFMFSQFKTVTSINFDEMDFHCTIEELGWLVQLEHLQSLVFYPRGSMSHTLNGGIYDTPRKVKTLQIKICEIAKINPPKYLLS